MRHVRRERHVTAVQIRGRERAQLDLPARFHRDRARARERRSLGQQGDDVSDGYEGARIVTTGYEPLQFRADPPRWARLEADPAQVPVHRLYIRQRPLTGQRISSSSSLGSHLPREPSTTAWTTHAGPSVCSLTERRCGFCSVRRGCARACAKAQRRVTHGMSADHAHDDHLTEAPGSRRQGVTVASLDLFQGCKYAGGRPDARSDRVATTQPLVGVNGDDLGWRLTRGAAEGG